MELQKVIAAVGVMFVWGCTTPVVQPEPPVTPAADPRPEILRIAAESECAKVVWKNRGRAPAAYVQGMALAYAYALKNPNAVQRGPIGSPDRDALAHYGLKADTESDRLRTTWTLLIGLGMRESSGRHCCGRDGSASNVTHLTAEAGVLQASYDSVHDKVRQIYLDGKAGKLPCDLDVWSKGVSCSEYNWKNWGTGEGVNFQKLSKECPNFSAQYNAALIRVLRRHHGPLNRREAEVIPACENMLKAIEKAVL